MKQKNISLRKAESREWKDLGYTGRMGRSTITIACPFCGLRNVTYVWSLAGSGKRCENNECRVMFTSWGMAFDDLQNYRKQEKP